MLKFKKANGQPATFRRMTMVAVLCAGTFGFTGLLQAQAPVPLQIGILSDMSGPYIDLSGPGSVVSAKMAIEDFGGIKESGIGYEGGSEGLAAFMHQKYIHHA